MPTSAEISDALLADLDPRLREPLTLMIQAAPSRIEVFSGRRSDAHQAELFAAAVKKYGSPEAARHYVAPPGHSRHRDGKAADLRFAMTSGQRWAHANAAHFGLHFPMSWEDWHIEPIDLDGPVFHPREDDDMTPAQADQLDRVESKVDKLQKALDALTAPRLPDHKDRDPQKVDLGDVITADGH